MAKICLDAGHYGKYNRSPVVPEYYESERMWKLTELLASALQKRGVTVVKTRTNQATDLALVSRGKKAQGCDFFLSLHSNASSTETPDFPVAIVFRDDTKTNLDELSEDIGLKLAKVCADVMGTKQEGRIMTRANSGDRDGNGYKDDEYYGVLHGAKLVKVPGVIMEHSFHTNKRAAQWLLSDSNLSKLAEAEADVLAAWLKGTAQKPTEPAVKPTASNTNYRVRVTIKDLNIRTEPRVSNGNSKGYIKPGVYTIVQESNGWGKLKSGAGWIKLSYTTKL